MYHAIREGIDLLNEAGNSKPTNWSCFRFPCICLRLFTKDTSEFYAQQSRFWRG